MTFRRRVRLDPRQVRDFRGRRVSGPGLALAGGGGGIGLILIVAFVLLGGDIGSLVGSGEAPVFPGNQSSAQRGDALADCETGADANARDDCRVVGFVNSVQSYWGEAFADAGEVYEPALTTLFDGAVETACGSATSAVGPFYCPLDGSVYLDLTFFDDLRLVLGAEGGPFAEAYVVAHEYGHHVQALLGLLAAAGSDRGADSRSVLTELQADCLAGVWTAHAAATGFLEPPTQDQIESGLDAAAAVGDDRIQRRSTGRIDPETWTHGSSQQRQDWFLIGLNGGELGACDPFA